MKRYIIYIKLHLYIIHLAKISFLAGTDRRPRYTGRGFESWRRHTEESVSEHILDLSSYLEASKSTDFSSHPITAQ